MYTTDQSVEVLRIDPIVAEYVRNSVMPTMTARVRVMVFKYPNVVFVNAPCISASFNLQS